MIKTLTAAVFVVLLLALSACGGGDSESGGSAPETSASADRDEATAVKSISDSLMSAQKSGDSTTQLLSMKRKDADCIGEGMVDKVGTEQLQKYGMLTEDMKAGTSLSSLKMSKADADSTTDVVFSCTDVEAMMKSAMGRAGTIPKQLQPCIDKVLTEENIRPMFSKIFEGKQAAAQKELATPLLACARKAQQQ
jgi:hypothetical protein